MIHVHRRIFSPNIRFFLNPRLLSTKSTKHGDDEWNNAWESAWLPDDLSSKNRAPWEADVNFHISENNNENPPLALPTDVDAETKAFVEDMTDNWEQRRKSPKFQQQQQEQQQTDQISLYSLKNVKKDYRLTKQRIHAGLWMKEIEKQEEAKLGDTILGGSDDIERLLDSCSEIFDTSGNSMNNSTFSSSEDVKNKPDWWELTSKGKDRNVWEMSQREEDILVQEFEHRIAFSKFQIASFIKTHIFSRRRPIDG